MPPKRRYFTDRQHQKNKRNRFQSDTDHAPSQHQQQNHSQHKQRHQHQHSHQQHQQYQQYQQYQHQHQQIHPSHRPSQSSADPANCAQELERLSLSYQGLPPPINEDQASSANQPAFLAGKSYQFNPGWTQGVNCAIQHNMQGNQPSINPPHQTCQPINRFPARPIANLPQRESLLCVNPSAILGSPLNQQKRSDNVGDSNPGMPSTRRGRKKKPRSARRKNCQIPAVNQGGSEINRIDIVLDTNILLAYQHFLQALVPLLGSSCRLLVPAAVIQELDAQKNRKQMVQVFQKGKCSSHQTMALLSRQATRWLLTLTRPGFSNVVLQKRDEESDEVQNTKNADTRILIYARQLHRQARSDDPGQVIVLLSNDNNLRLLAQNEGICSLQMADFCHSHEKVVDCIRAVAPPFLNPAITGPPIPSQVTHSLPKRALPPTTHQANETARKSWVPRGQDGQFTFTSSLPSSTRPSDSTPSNGPDQQLVRLKYQIRKTRSCRGCESAIQFTPQVSPDQIHHNCPKCCETICKGCMGVRDCKWNCLGPLHGTDCEAIKCCATGRALIWIELLEQLDSCFLRNQYKLAFKHGAKVTHLYGDEALTRYMRVAHALLVVSGKEDEQLGFLESILISSRFIDALSQTFLCAPLVSWHFRSELFLSAIRVVQAILQKLEEPWKILNSEFIKASTSNISIVDDRQHQAVWRKIVETTNQPNATAVKVKQLQDLFPNLMADVEDILHNQPASSSTTLKELLDNAIHVPLCYVLENLFRAAIEMETRPSNHTVTLPDNIQVTAPLSDDTLSMTSALTELKIVYESRIGTPVNSDAAKGADPSGTSEGDTNRGGDQVKPEGKEKYQTNSQDVAGDEIESRDSKIKCTDDSGSKNQAVTRNETQGASHAISNTKENATSKTQKKAQGNSKPNIQSHGSNDAASSKTDSDLPPTTTKVLNNVDNLSISSSALNSEDSDDSSDIVFLY